MAMFRKSDAPPRPVVSADQERRIALKAHRKTAWERLLDEARLRGYGELLYFYSSLIADVLDDTYHLSLREQRKGLIDACPLDDWSRKHDFCGMLWQKEVDRQRTIRARREKEWRVNGRVGLSPSQKARTRLPLPEPALDQGDADGP